MAYIEDKPVEQSSIEKLGDPIWSNLYRVSIKYKDSLSIDNIRQFGLPTVGDDGLDFDMWNQPLHVMITINDMVEYFKSGTTVTMHDNLDAERIYRIINNYLLAWREQLDRGLNIGDAPYDDLVLLDEFAVMLHPVAVTYTGDTKTSTSLFMNLFGSGKTYASRSSFFTPESKVGEKTKHVSLAKLFTKSLKESGGGGWK